MNQTLINHKFGLMENRILKLEKLTTEQHNAIQSLIKYSVKKAQDLLEYKSNIMYIKQDIETLAEKAGVSLL